MKAFRVRFDGLSQSCWSCYSYFARVRTGSLTSETGKKKYEKEKGRAEKEKKGLFFNFQISNRLLFFI